MNVEPPKGTGKEQRSPGSSRRPAATAAIPARQLLCVQSGEMACHGRGARGNRQDPHEDSERGGRERLQVSLTRLETGMLGACTF